MRRGLGTWILLCVCIGGGPALGHSDPRLLPPEDAYLVKWYQPHGTLPVEDWEIEVIPVDHQGARFIAPAQVMPEDSCWALNVPIDEPAIVRIRSVYGNQRSAWSQSTSVPEPGFALSSFAAIALLASLPRRPSRRRGRSAEADGKDL
jgi:hypothetical protein